MGTEAMGIAKRITPPPDVIVVELIYGHRDDLVLLDELRAASATRTVPVVSLVDAPEMPVL